MKKALFIVALLVASCGSPRSVVKVRNNAEGVTTSITTNVGPGGSTTVTVQPNTDVVLGDDYEQ